MKQIWVFFSLCNILEESCYLKNSLLGRLSRCVFGPHLPVTNIQLVWYLVCYCKGKVEHNCFVDHFFSCYELLIVFCKFWVHSKVRENTRKVSEIGVIFPIRFLQVLWKKVSTHEIILKIDALYSKIYIRMTQFQANSYTYFGKNIFKLS